MDEKKEREGEQKIEPPIKETSPVVTEDVDEEGLGGTLHKTQLHYNIQIHLPESRDQAVYDALFKSLKKHLF